MGSNRMVSKKIRILSLEMGWWFTILNGAFFFIVVVCVGWHAEFFLFGGDSNERQTPKPNETSALPATFLRRAILHCFS